MNELEDIQLKKLLQELTPDSPTPGFTTKVMDKIFEEANALDHIKKQQIFGKGFWIISLLFIALMSIVFVLSNNGIQTENQINNFFLDINNGIENKTQPFFTKINTVPIGIAVGFIALSILLFIDRIISSNSKIFN